MNLAKKALSLGTSAALVASLLATVAAPAAFASSSATSGGTIVPGGPSSTAITITFAESAGASHTADWHDGTSTFTLTDSAGSPTYVTFSGTPICTPVATPAPLKCSVTLGSAASGSNNKLTLIISGTDGTITDSAVVTGLKIKAIAGAPSGAVNLGTTATDTDGIGIGTSTVTASGYVLTNPSNTTLTYALNSGSPDFQVYSAHSNLLTIGAFGASPSETVQIADSSPLAGSLTTNSAMTYGHAAGSTLTQSVVVPFTAVVATIGDGVTVTTTGSATFVANHNNQGGNTLSVSSLPFGTIPAGTVVTFQITTAGAQFSNSSGITASWDVSAPCTTTCGTTVLSFDRQTLTYTTATALSPAEGTIVLAANYDIAASVPNGTAVSVTVTVGGYTVVSGSPATVGTVGTTLIGFSAAYPPANIALGSNDVTTALVTLKELTAGTIQDIYSGDGYYNGFEVCLNSGNGETFSRAPWAVVTVGDLKLNNGGVAATQVAMTYISNTCYGFRVFSQSTVASTIEIRGGADAANTTPLPSGPTNGPRISVPYDELPSQVYLTGTIVDTGTTATPVWAGSEVSCSPTVNPGCQLSVGVPVVIAYLSYNGNNPKVAVLSAPYMLPGSVHQLAGSVTITETYAGQLTTGTIHVCLPQSSKAFTSANVNLSGFGEQGQYAASDLPLINTNNPASGMTASFDDWTYYDTNFDGSGNQYLAMPCFDVTVNTPSVTAPGVITISNILYDVKSDAPLGPVQIEVSNYGSAYNNYYGDTFDTTLVNANIGVQPSAAMSAATAVGATKNATFTTKTKVVKVGSYVTWKFGVPVALAGKTVTIWISTKQADGTWGAWKALTSRLVDINGNAYFWWKFKTPTWLAVRASYGPDATYAMSVSPSPQARWTK